MESEKVLRALLAHPWSTREALATLAGVNKSTVNSVIERNRAALERRSREGAVGRGRPPAEYQIHDAWRGTIEQRFSSAVSTVDPAYTSVRLVEQAASALRDEQDPAVRERVHRMARVQYMAARSALRGNLPWDLDLRLHVAEAVLFGSSCLDEPWVEAASYSAMRAAMRRPPRRPWERWSGYLREFASRYDAQWHAPRNRDVQHGEVEPLALVIDAVPDDPDRLSSHTQSVLSDAGITIVTIASQRIWDAGGGASFLHDLAQLSSDPMSCLAPLYVTLDSHTCLSQDVWEGLERVGEGIQFEYIVDSARQAMIEAVQAEEDPAELGHETAFYGALLSARSHHAGTSFWQYCRGPALLDMRENAAIGQQASAQNGIYVARAADADPRPQILDWLNTISASPSIAPVRGEDVPLEQMVAARSLNMAG